MRNSFLFVLTAILFSLPFFNSEAEAVTYNQLTGCNPSSAEKTYYSNNFNSELKKRGIKTSIKVNGKTLNVNKSFAVNNCLLIYGNHSDVPKTGKFRQKIGTNNKYQYIGYNKNGRLVENIEYRVYGSAPDFVKTRPFIKHPWNNKDVADIAKWATPLPEAYNTNNTRIIRDNGSTGTTADKIAQLNKAIDTQYLREASNPLGNLGSRGYFPHRNTSLNLALNGSNLINYASVPFFAEPYTFGMFYLYHKCFSNTSVCYSSYAIPPSKLLFDRTTEKPDLAVKTFTASTTTPWEGHKVTFSFTLENKGNIPVNRPKAVITYAGNREVVTFTGSLKPGATVSRTVTFNSPLVSKDTNYTAKVVANPDQDNPKYDNMSNNEKTVGIKVRNITRDLSVHSIDIKGNTYFSNSTDNFEKLFEGEEVYFRYRLHFKSNKSDEKIVNPVVHYGKLNGKDKKERLSTTINSGSTTNWIPAGFEYQNH